MGENGRPDTCEITEPSGFPTLSDATCTMALRRAGFAPQTDETGARVKCSYQSRVGWILPVEHVSGPMPSARTLSFASFAGGQAPFLLGYQLANDPSGPATSCKVIQPSGVVALDAVACDVTMPMMPETRFTDVFYRPDGEPFMRAFRGWVVWHDRAQLEEAPTTHQY